MTGNTLFQSKISVNIFKVKIYILKQVKKFIIAFAFILQEMKAVTKSNWGLGVHLTPPKVCETKTKR